jgi:hypothetical protein
MSARSSATRSASVLSVLGLVALVLTGCPKDPYDPQTWIDKLDDPGEAAQALQRLQQLKDPVAIPALGKFWRKHNYPSKVLRIIIDLASQVNQEKGTGPTWEPAIPFLVESIDNFDIGDQTSIDDASVSADAIGLAADVGWKDTKGDAVKTLIAAATKTMPKLSPGQRVRIAAVRALGKFGSHPQVVETLVRVLQTDVKQQPIKVNAAAANALGDTASVDAIDALLVAAFAIPPIYKTQIRTALAAIGRPVIPRAVAVFKGKHEAINALAKKENFATNCAAGEGPKTTCTAPGALEFKAADILSTLYAKEAVPMLVAALKDPPRTAFFDPETGAAGPPTHNGILDALRIIGDPKSAEAVYEFWSNPATDDALRPLAIDVYSMLTRDTKSLPQLEKMIKDEQEEEAVRLAASMAYGRLARKESDLKLLDFMIERFRKPADENEAKAKAAKTGSEKAEFEGVRDSYRAYQKGFEENKDRALVGIKCKDDATCYIKYLEANDIVMGQPGLPRAERALLEIAKLGSKASGVLPDLLRHAAATERIVRQGVLLALVQVAPQPCQDCIKGLGEVIDKQKDQTTLDYLTADTRIVMYYFMWAGVGTGAGN